MPTMPQVSGSWACTGSPAPGSEDAAGSGYFAGRWSPGKVCSSVCATLRGKEHSAAGHIGPGFLPLLLSRGRGPALCLGGQGSDHTPTGDFRKPACASPAPSGLSRLRPLSEIPGLFPSPRTLFEAQSLQSWPTLCDPMGCNVPGSSVHGIFQVRILGRVVMPSSRGSP